jgi:hypothetical protein
VKAAGEHGGGTAAHQASAFFMPQTAGLGRGPGQPVVIGLAVQIGDPGVHQLVLDDGVHRGLLGTSSRVASPSM